MFTDSFKDETICSCLRYRS